MSIYGPLKPILAGCIPQPLTKRGAMIDAEKLYTVYSDLYLARGSTMVTWNALFANTKAIWETFARYIATEYGKPSPPPSTYDDYYTLLKLYGRHKPTCPTTGACDCGFAAVEPLLK